MIQRLLKRLNIAPRLSTFLILFILTPGLSACSGADAPSSTPEHIFAGAALDNPDPLPDFTLTSAGGPVALSDFRGQYVFIYFGYMSCPDFCPTTMAKLATIHEELGEDADKIQVIMITVDPERDAPEALATYLAAFNPTFIGLTGDKEDIDRAGKPFGVFYQYHEGDTAAGYLVDHSTRTYLVGPEGQWLAAYPYDATTAGILADLRWLFSQ